MGLLLSKCSQDQATQDLALHSRRWSAVGVLQVGCNQSTFREITDAPFAISLENTACSLFRRERKGCVPLVSLLPPFTHTQRDSFCMCMYSQKKQACVSCNRTANELMLSSKPIENSVSSLFCICGVEFKITSGGGVEACVLPLFFPLSPLFPRLDPIVSNLSKVSPPTHTHTQLVHQIASAQRDLFCFSALKCGFPLIVPGVLLFLR